MGSWLPAASEDGQRLPGLRHVDEIEGSTRRERGGDSRATGGMFKKLEKVQRQETELTKKGKRCI